MKLLLVFFFKYLLAPIMAAIMLALMGSLKSVRQKLSMKKVIIFSLLAGLCLGLPSLFGFLRNEFVWGGLILSVIIYLGLGILFLQVVKSKFIKVNDERSPILEILLIITSSIIGMWVYYLVFDWTSNGLPYTIWAMLNLLWFTVPYFVDRSFLLFRKIQPPIYELWKTPDSVFNRNYWDTIDNFNTKSVKVRIKRKAGDANYAVLSVRLPDGISLGDWFNWFIEDQNKRFPSAPIDTRMDTPESGWIFYVSKWFEYPLFIRVLDPRLTGTDNQIRKHQTIYIKRVKIINHIQHEED